MKNHTELSQNSCLIIEDNRTTQFLKNIVTTAFPGVQVYQTDLLGTAANWLTDKNHQIHNHSLRLVIVDLCLPDQDILSFILSLKKFGLNFYTVAVAICDKDNTVFNALSVGVDGYILKKEDTKVMAEKLRAIVENKPILSSVMAEKLLQHFENPNPNETIKTNLTERENTVLSHISQNIPMNEISEKLESDENKIFSHIKVVLQKLCVSCKTNR